MLGQEAHVGAGDDQDGRRLDVVHGGRRFGDTQVFQVVLLHVAAHDDAPRADLFEQLGALGLAAEQRVSPAAIQTQRFLVQR
ncbi:hypothetical protein D3C87_2007700 [compost metagenome]